MLNTCNRRQLLSFKELAKQTTGYPVLKNNMYRQAAGTFFMFWTVLFCVITVIYKEKKE